MKRILTLTIAGISLFFIAPSAKADLFSVAFDIPVQYSFDQENSADKVSGFKAAVNLPILLGIAFEDYTVTLDTGGSGGVAREIGITMFDLFLDLPTPLINIGLGIGAGTAEVTDASPSTEQFDNATMLQGFITLGFPMYTLFDIHIGYHMLKGTADNKTSGATGLILDGDMISVGLRVGF